MLDGVDLRVEPGSLTVVVGANGSGKSTLLRIIAGLSNPTRGSVSRIANVTTMAFAPEHLSAGVRMSARVYLTHIGRIRGLDDATVRSTIDALVERLGLEPGPDAPIATLSKGNSQKVALIQALMAPAQVLMLDEPTSGLDAEARAALAALLDERTRSGCAVVAASHQPLGAVQHVSHLGLHDGRLHDVAVRPTRASNTIVLWKPDGDETVLRALPGVVTFGRANEGTFDAVVDAAATDAFLAVAIHDGWSVRSLAPDRRDSAQER